MGRPDLLVPASGPAADVLARAGAIGVFRDTDGFVTCVDDLSEASSARTASAFAPALTPPLPLFDRPGVGTPSAIELRGGALLVPPPGGVRPSVEAGPVVRALVRGALASPECGDHPPIVLPGGWMLLNAGAGLAHIAERIATRARLWQQMSDHDFANSAYYMGAKRTLVPFLMEAIAQIVPDNATFVDLMCGSGAVSGAAARLWPTFASDAMTFCLPLAAVQCGGYSSHQAASALAEVLPRANANYAWLNERLGTFLEMEEKLLTFPGDYDSLAKAYKDFAELLPTFPSTARSGGWDPASEVERRRAANQFSEPSCLFTAYFANVYLGLRQAAEVDSLRHAISQLPSRQDQGWAMGALVAAVSAVSTTYGGHFAQPYAAAHNLSPRRIARVVMKRAMSVYREFEVRLTALAALSEGVEHAAVLVQGPWRSALDTVARSVGEGPVVVYLDAPYRRDEYSRYYHVLETLVAYNYPSASARTKVPEKATGERFSSEFFTRSAERMRRALVNIIDDILQRGWTCAWSYSSAGDARLTDVLRGIRLSKRACSVAAPYVYKRQGLHSQRRDVTEYLIGLEPL